jgi:hypothetical protein
VVANNIFYNNRSPLDEEYRYLPFMHDSALLLYNLFDFDSCADLRGKGICGEGNIFGADPMFVDTAASDFRLLPCSPAINAGLDSIYAVLGIARDHAGNPRIRDGRSDMGALESASVVEVTPPVVTPACSPQRTGSVQFAVDNACPPLAYQWASGTASGTGSDSLASGVYRFTVTDQRGKTLVRDISVPDGAPTVSATITPAACATCTDGAIRLSVLPVSTAYTYQWSHGATVAQPGGLAPGNYTVTISDPTTSCTYVYAYTVSVVSSTTLLTVNNGLSLSPNPATTTAQLQWPSGTPITFVRVYAADGRVASEHKIAPSDGNSLSLSLTGLAAGLYECRLYAGSRLAGWARLVRQ